MKPFAILLYFGIHFFANFSSQAGGWVVRENYKFSEDKVSSGIQQIVCNTSGDTVYTLSHVAGLTDNRQDLTTWLVSTGSILSSRSIGEVGDYSTFVRISSDAAYYILYGKNPAHKDSMGVRIYSLVTHQLIDSCVIDIGKYPLLSMDYRDKSGELIVGSGEATRTWVATKHDFQDVGSLQTFNWRAGVLKSRKLSGFYIGAMKRCVERDEIAFVADSAHDSSFGPNYGYGTVGLLSSADTVINVFTISGTDVLTYRKCVALGASRRVLASCLNGNIDLLHYDNTGRAVKSSVQCASSAFEFVDADRYLVALRSDNTVVCINVGQAAVCGMYPVPRSFANAVTCSSPKNNELLVGGVDGHLLAITTIVDTLLPTITAVANKQKQYVGAPVTFHLQCTNLDSTQCKWSFGDTESSNEIFTQHVYTKAGVYRVEALVRIHGVDTLVQLPHDVVILDSLHPAFTMSPMQGPAPLNVHLQYSGTGSPTQCYWSSTGVRSDTGLSAQFTLTKNGLHIVEMRVSDGLTDTSILSSRPIVVSPYKTTLLDTQSVIVTKGKSSSSYRQSSTDRYEVSCLLRRHDSVVIVGVTGNYHKDSYGTTTNSSGYHLNELRENLTLGQAASIWSDPPARHAIGIAIQNERESDIWCSTSAYENAVLSPLHYIVHQDGSFQRIGWTRKSGSFQFLHLDNGIDCYNYTLGSPKAYGLLEFRRDSLLLGTDSLSSRAVVVSVGDGLQMMCFASSEDSTQNVIDVRRYMNSGDLISRTQVGRAESQFFDCARQIGDSRYMLVGSYADSTGGLRKGGLITCVDAQGNELWRHLSTSYQKFTLIEALNAHTTAVYGSIDYQTPGFLVLNDSGRVLGEFLMPINSSHPYCAARQKGVSYFGTSNGLDAVVYRTESSVLRELLGIPTQYSEEQNTKQLQISPNPCDRQMLIGLSADLDQQCSIEVYSANASRMLTTTAQLYVGWNAIPLALDGLPPGPYLLRLSTANTSVTRCFTVYR